MQLEQSITAYMYFYWTFMIYVVEDVNWCHATFGVSIENSIIH